MPAKKTTTRKTTAKAPAKKPETKTVAAEETADDAKLDSSAIDALNSANGEAKVESFESAELAALREELAKAKEELARARTNPTDDEGRPVPEEQLTDEQKQIRALQDELARTKGKSLDTAKEFVEDEEDGEAVVIHILEDGFTAMGRVFYRGQEVSFGPKAFEDTKNRLGESWLDMDEEAQYEKWGGVMFAHGEWPGRKKYEDTDKSIRVVAPVTKF